MLSQMTVSETMATIDVKMLMDKNSFQSIATQTDKVMRFPGGCLMLILYTAYVKKY